MTSKILRQFFLSVIASVCCMTNAMAQVKITELGPQVSAALIQGSEFVVAANGKELVYTVVRGRPASLLGYELLGGRKVVDLALNGMDGSWDLESSGGILYVAGANGHLFSHRPGTNELEDLGIPLPGEKLIWDMTAGKEGEIFGGTYPGCRIFRYKPSEGFKDITSGPVVQGENYLRSIEYQPSEDKLFAGIGSHVHFVEVNPRTGEVKNMLPSEYNDHQYVYSIGIAPGMKGGDRLFAWLTSSTSRKTLVYNLKTDKIEHVLPTVDVRSVILSPGGDRVYYTNDGSLMETSFTNSGPKIKKIPQAGITALASYWGKDGKLYMLGSGGKLLSYHPSKKKVTISQLDIPRKPIDIQSIGMGPDGKIWIGGYLAGGHATYDPETGVTKEYKGLHQTEGLAYLGDTMFFGVYPKAELYKFNTKQAWSTENENPELITKVAGQDRPFAVLPSEKYNKVYFGTVPDYGKLGGKLVEYDASTGHTTDFESVVKDQSVISLADAGDYIIGGTTISGGLGILPSEKEGKIFGWDPATNTKLFEMGPVPNAIAISGLSTAPDGKVWGLAEGIVFVFDPVQRKVTAMSSVYPAKAYGSHMWRNAFIVHHPNGKVYMTANSDIYQVDPKTMAVTKLAESAGCLIIDKKGTMYFKRGINLYRMEP